MLIESKSFLLLFVLHAILVSQVVDSKNRRQKFRKLKLSNNNLVMIENRQLASFTQCQPFK